MKRRNNKKCKYCGRTLYSNESMEQMVCAFCYRKIKHGGRRTNITEIPKYLRGNGYMGVSISRLLNIIKEKGEVLQKNLPAKYRRNPHYFRKLEGMGLIKREMVKSERGKSTYLIRYTGG